MERLAGWRAMGLGHAVGIVTGASWGFSWSLARLIAPRLAPCSALLLVARSVAVLEQLEGELCVHGLPANLASDDGPQRLVKVTWELRRDGPMERLLLVNNAGERTVPRHTLDTPGCK
uniref:Uncharacterized protein n=1 Tax=Podarcis muralis TaxID=64176 RepID=A0A670I948_PODMU